MTELEQSGRSMKARYAAAATAAIVLIACGWGYHILAERLGVHGEVKVMPTVPFKYFPRFINGWEGHDESISETVLKAAANDDYVCRIYRNIEKQLNASLYVAYTCEPRRMLGHRPQICYVGSGWRHEGTEKGELTLSDGRRIDVLVHRFSKEGLAEQQVFVLNYYVVNGEITTDQASFSGLKWRRRRTAADNADYVAQVQVSSETTAGAYALAQAVSEQILFHLPRSEKTDGPPPQERAAG